MTFSGTKMAAAGYELLQYYERYIGNWNSEICRHWPVLSPDRYISFILSRQ